MTRIEEIEDLLKQFNASKDPDERARLIKKMEPFDKALFKYIKESKLITAAYERLGKLYAQIEIERRKERAERNLCDPEKQSA